MPKKIVAVVGRPNVGKSTLFNKLTGRRISIVEDTPGVTRDRISAVCEWSGREFTLVDTGGYEPKSSDAILENIRVQAEIAIDAADAIIFVTDLCDGVTATDMDIAQMLRRSGKPIVLCVNKADSVGKNPAEFYEFYNLALGDPIPVSSVHGHGTGDLLDRIIGLIGPDDDPVDEKGAVRVAVAGRPNVGKSSLVNMMSGEDRMMVMDMPGTTRDAVDTEIDNKYGKFVFVDTAGIRRKSRIDGRIEHFSVLRAQMAIERADVCLLLIDGTEGPEEQDTKIAGIAHSAGKASIIAVNKWDAAHRAGITIPTMKKRVADCFSFMPYAPVEFISAKTGSRVDRLYSLINHVYSQNNMRIPTGKLNDMLADATARVQPPTDKGRRLKILFMTQASVAPPTFVTFVNKAELFHFSYQRYIENRIRETFSLDAAPIRFSIRERREKTGGR